MTRRIEKLTPEQEAYLPIFRQEWLERCSLGVGVTDDDRRAAVRVAYEAIGQQPPVTVILSSPAMMALGQAALWDQLGGQLGDQLRGQLRDQLWGQLGGQLRDQLWGQLGGQLWDQLGDQLRGQLGGQLRGQLRDQLRGQLRDQLWDQLGGQLRGQLGGQLGDQLGGQLWDQLWDQLRGQLGGQLWDQLWDQLRGQLRGQLGGQLRDQLWGQLGDQLRGQLWMGWWGSWVAWLRFGEWIGATLNADDLAKCEALPRSTFAAAPYAGLCFVSAHPVTVEWDERQMLHCATGRAVAFSDGWALWAWHGVRVSQQVIEQPNTLTPEQIRDEENAEVRRVMIERFGADRFLTGVGAELLQQDDFGKLWRADLPDDEPLVMVECVDPSTGRTYHLRVPPDRRTAKDALAWTFEMGEAQYEPAVQT